MLKMIEVIGISPAGYSEAAKDAVEKIVRDGEKVHFFEIIEQRGAVRDGRLKEFQVKLKVAVEAFDAPKDKKGKSAKDVCPTCMKPAGHDGHMCVPLTEKDKTCDWCGALIPDERHLCDEKVKELAYICNSCGRTAVSPEHLCSPKKIKQD